jgi:hypothetical protein
VDLISAIDESKSKDLAGEIIVIIKWSEGTKLFAQ